MLEAVPKLMLSIKLLSSAIRSVETRFAAFINIWDGNDLLAARSVSFG